MAMNFGLLGRGFSRLAAAKGKDAAAAAPPPPTPSVGEPVVLLLAMNRASFLLLTLTRA